MFYAKRLMEGFFNYEEPDASPPGPSPTVADASPPGPSPSVADASPPGPSPSVAAVLSPGPSPSVAGNPSITLLTNLIYRIDQEILTLGQATQTPTIIAKNTSLNLMRYQISEFIEKISSGEMTLADTGITTESANAFLASLGKAPDSATSYAPLFNTSEPPSASTINESSDQSYDSTGFGLGDIQSIFANIQDAKWRYELSYDPTYTQKTNLLDRLTALENRIMSYAKTGTAIPDDVKKILTAELQLLTNIIMGTKTIENTTTATKTKTGGTDSYMARPQSTHTRMENGGTYVSDPSRIYSIPTKHVGAGFSLFASSDNSNPDAMVRPGFIMTEDQIRHRGSTAAFNTQAVGGADYKKRAEEVCRQIRGANIGAPADFGCIENTSEVSANYSWKGNYEMVCNRLGDTWGSWYPQMFGCPNYDPVNEYNGKLL